MTLTQQLDREIRWAAQCAVDNGMTLAQAIELFECALVSAALKKENGHHTKAAARLGVHRNTMHRKQLDYRIRVRRVAETGIGRRQVEVAR